MLRYVHRCLLHTRTFLCAIKLSCAAIYRTILRDADSRACVLTSNFQILWDQTFVRPIFQKQMHILRHGTSTGTCTSRIWIEVDKKWKKMMKGNETDFSTLKIIKLNKQKYNDESMERKKLIGECSQKCMTGKIIFYGNKLQFFL